MRDARAAWARVGDAVWTRFCALGVQDAAGATRRWLAHDDRAWLDVERPDVRRLALEVTRSALGGPLGKPDRAALAAYCCNGAQLERVLAAPSDVRLPLVHATLDGFSVDEIAALLGLTATAVQLALTTVDDELAALADPQPDDALPDGHLTTVQLHGFALELLAPLSMQQLEVHLGGCSWCLARFTAWGDSRTQFDALPPPLAPPRRSRVLPLVVGAVGLLGLVGAVTGIVAWRVDRVEAQVDAVTWHGEYATVELRMGGRTLGKDERPLPGSLVAVWLDAHHAPFMSIARQTGDEFELLVSGPVARDGMHLAPVEVLVGDTPATWLHVVLAEHELNVEGVAAAVLSGAPLTPATSVSLTP